MYLAAISHHPNGVMRVCGFIGKKYTEKQPEKEEYDVASITYHIVLKIIMEEKGADIVLEEWSVMGRGDHQAAWNLDIPQELCADLDVPSLGNPSGSL